MPMRFRRSIKLGKGVRLNVSKTFARIESLNVSPTFISVLASAAIDALKPLERYLRA